jgi:hypothetical protein
MLIGNGPDAMTPRHHDRQRHEARPGIGTCGKAGQGVPVGVGQPAAPRPDPSARDYAGASPFEWGGDA